MLLPVNEMNNKLSVTVEEIIELDDTIICQLFSPIVTYTKIILVIVY